MLIPRPLTFSLGALMVAVSAFAADETAANRPKLPAVSSGARVIEGPGYRIERVNPTPTAAARGAETARSQLLLSGVRNQTVFCRAGENLLISGMTLESTGSGVVAQRGCRLRIVDSQLRTDGVALIVEAGASVELQNAVLTSRTGSIEAAANARVAAQGASFAGPATLSRADFVDRGGNLWGSAP